MKLILSAICIAALSWTVSVKGDVDGSGDGSGDYESDLDLTCESWSAPSKFHGCVGGSDWISLDTGMDMSQTAACEQLCRQEIGRGCCYLGETSGCHGKKYGNIDNHNTGSQVAKVLSCFPDTEWPKTDSNLGCWGRYDGFGVSYGLDSEVVENRVECQKKCLADPKCTAIGFSSKNAKLPNNSCQICNKAGYGTFSTSSLDYYKFPVQCSSNSDCPSHLPTCGPTNFCTACTDYLATETCKHVVTTGYCTGTDYNVQGQVYRNWYKFACPKTCNICEQ